MILLIMVNLVMLVCLALACIGVVGFFASADDGSCLGTVLSVATFLFFGWVFLQLLGKLPALEAAL